MGITEELFQMKSDPRNCERKPVKNLGIQRSLNPWPLDAGVIL